MVCTLLSKQANILTSCVSLSHENSSRQIFGVLPSEGGGGGDSDIKSTGVLVGNFEKRGGRGVRSFSPLRGTNSETTHNGLL